MAQLSRKHRCHGRVKSIYSYSFLSFFHRIQHVYPWDYKVSELPRYELLWWSDKNFFSFSNFISAIGATSRFPSSTFSLGSAGRPTWKPFQTKWFESGFYEPATEVTDFQRTSWRRRRQKSFSMPSTTTTTFKKKLNMSTHFGAGVSWLILIASATLIDNFDIRKVTMTWTPTRRKTCWFYIRNSADK